MRSAKLSPANMHVGPNMTPLVDVVMVILIFLMLAGSFASNERYIVGKDAAIVIPTSTPSPGLSIIHQKPQLDIYVQQSATGIDVMQLSGGVIVGDNRALLAELKARHAEYVAAGSANEVEVIIRPAASTVWSPIIATYEAALRAEYKTIKFAYTD